MYQLYVYVCVDAASINTSINFVSPSWWSVSDPEPTKIWEAVMTKVSLIPVFSRAFNNCPFSSLYGKLCALF